MPSNLWMIVRRGDQFVAVREGEEPGGEVYGRCRAEDVKRLLRVHREDLRVCSGNARGAFMLCRGPSSHRTGVHEHRLLSPSSRGRWRLEGRFF